MHTKTPALPLHPLPPMPLFENLTSSTPLQNTSNAARNQAPAGRTSSPLRVDTTRQRNNGR